LAEVIAPIIRHRYTFGPQIPAFDADSDRPSWSQEGKELAEVVEEVIGQPLDFEGEIASALCRNERVNVADGEYAFFDDMQNYVKAETYANRWESQWDSVLQALKHEQRFFNNSAKQFFDNLFRDIDNLKVWNEESKCPEPVIRVLPIGTELYRARKCDSDSVVCRIQNNPTGELGPPPRDKASAGRMNAEGVVVFYGGMEAQTCIAELRPYIAGRTATIKARTTKEIRVLDFTRLSASGEEDFNSDPERKDFLASLGYLISKPVIPGGEADYVITQTLAEYLAYVHAKRVDGVLFNSAQRSGGVAIALFASQPYFEDTRSETWPLEFLADTVAFVKIDGIKYGTYPVGIHVAEDAHVHEYPVFEADKTEANETGDDSPIY
jgi:hypothetical protein